MNTASVWLKHLIPALQAIQNEINDMDRQEAKAAEKVGQAVRRYCNSSAAAQYP